MSPALIIRTDILAAALRERIAETAAVGTRWIPVVDDAIPAALIDVLDDVACAARGVSGLNGRPDGAVQRVINNCGELWLLIPSADGEQAERFVAATSSSRRFAVADHFVHAELLSKAWQRCRLAGTDASTVIQVLLQLDIDARFSGARAGHDAHLLATAVNQLPGIQVVGLLFDDPSLPSAAAAAGRSDDLWKSITGASRQTQRMLQLSGIGCSHLVCSQRPAPSQETRYQRPATATHRIPWTDRCESLTEFICDLSVRNTEFLSVEGMVISRPSLDRAVINVGTALLGAVGERPRTRGLGSAPICRADAGRTAVAAAGATHELTIGARVHFAVLDPLRTLLQASAGNLSVRCRQTQLPSGAAPSDAVDMV